MRPNHICAEGSFVAERPIRTRPIVVRLLIPVREKDFSAKSGRPHDDLLALFLRSRADVAPLAHASTHASSIAPLKNRARATPMKACWKGVRAAMLASESREDAMADEDDPEDIGKDMQDAVSLIVGAIGTIGDLVEILVSEGIVDPQNASASMRKTIERFSAEKDQLLVFAAKHVVARLDGTEPPDLPPMNKRH